MRNYLMVFCLSIISPAFSQESTLVDSIISAYSKRVQLNGGSINDNDLSAITTFVNTARVNLYWDKLIDVGVLSGNNINASLVKLKFPPSGTFKLENNGFVAADYSPDKGYQLSLNKFLSTQTNLSTLSLNGLFGLSMWLMGQGSAFMGSSNAGTPFSLLSGTPSNAIAYIGLPPAYVSVGGAIPAKSDAFYHIIKQALDSAKVFVDGNAAGGNNSLITTTILRNADVEVFKDASSTGTGVFYCIDNGTLTNLQVKQLYNDVRQLMYDLGRKIAPPVISAEGLYSTPQEVTIKESPSMSSLSGATIHYTVDGSIPTIASPVYLRPLTVAETKHLQAISVKNEKTSKLKSSWVSIVPKGFSSDKYYTAHVMVNLLAFTDNMVEWVKAMKASGYNLIWAHLDDYTGNYITTLKSLMDAAQEVGGIKVMPGASWWVDPTRVVQVFQDTWQHPALFKIEDKPIFTGWDYHPDNQHIVDSLLLLKNISRGDYYLWCHSRYPYSYDGNSSWIGEYQLSNGYLAWSGKSTAHFQEEISHLFDTRPQIDGLINFAVDQGLGSNEHVIRTNKLITQESIQRGKFSMAGVSAYYASVSFSDFGFKGAAQIWDSILALPIGSRPTAMSDITANDYAELSYISPMVIPPTKGLSYIPPFSGGFNLGDNIRYPLTDHSGIQKFLRPWADAFLNNKAVPTFSEDKIFAWYWLHPMEQQPSSTLPVEFSGFPHLNQQWWNNTVYAKGNVSIGGTDQIYGMKTYIPDGMRKIRMAVHLTAPAQLKINNTLSGIKPAGAAFFEIDMGSFRGTPTFSIVRNSVEVKKGNGLQPITDNAFPGGWNFLSTEITSTLNSGNAIYRINAGGKMSVTSQSVFSADAYHSPSPDDTYSGVSAIANTTDDEIYQTERNSSTQVLNYNFPVNPGKYRVILHFAEIYHSGLGNRVFDVNIEGSKVLDDYDIVKKVGSFTATTENFEVNVTDSLLNIDFSSLQSDGGRDRPKVSAIEIISYSDNRAPNAEAGADKTITLPVTSSVLYGKGTDDDGTISSFQWSQVSGPNTAVFGSSTLANCTVSGLTSGSYVFNLVVTDNEHFASLGDQMTLTVHPFSGSGTPVYRINAGGSQVTHSKGIFNADVNYSPSPGDFFTTTTAIAGTNDDAIYQSERSGSTGQFGYSFPVNNGSYTVVLHFAEIYFTGVGNRVFDVSIEGTKVLDDYDIVKKVGSFTATTETFGVTVTDGILNINFNSLAAVGGRDRAKVSAIEILSNSKNAAPSAIAGNDRTITLPVTTTALNGSGTDTDGTITSYMWSQVSGPNNAVFSSNTIANPNISGLIAGTYVFNLLVRDNEQFPSVPDEMIVSVNPLQVTGTPAYRINSGGREVTNSKGVFVSDTYFSPVLGDTYTTLSPIAGTVDDAIYQSERSGSAGAFNYSLPVQNGQYTVVLHFAEIYYTSPNNRVFDVSIEGAKVLDNFDIVKKVGSFTATTEVFAVNVSDGVLNIDFSSLASDGGQDRPKVSAIEVLRTSGAQSIVEGNRALEVVSSTERAQQLLATISPNPSDHYFNLSLSETGMPIDVRIFNVSGQLIEAGQNLAAGNTLRIGDTYRSGLYYAVVRQGKQQVILRFVKQHQ